MFDHLPQLSFEVVQDRIDKLIIATTNKLEREWPWNLSHCAEAAGVLRSLLYVSGTTYRTILYFCADKPPDWARRPEYAISVLPLARTILDGVFTTVFLFEDLPSRLAWYQKSGWREIREYHDRLLERYGDKPNWTQWLEAQGRFLELTRTGWGVTDREATDPKLIQYWPIPGKMLRGRDHLSDQNRDFLGYLNDWFYRHLSSASHQSWPGLAARSHFFFFERSEDDKRDAFLDKYKSDAVITTVVVLMALLSEIELQLQFGLDKQLQFVWGFLKQVSVDATELHDLRYARLG